MGSRSLRRGEEVRTLRHLLTSISEISYMISSIIKGKEEKLSALREKSPHFGEEWALGNFLL